MIADAIAQRIEVLCESLLPPPPPLEVVNRPQLPLAVAAPVVTVPVTDAKNAIRIAHYNQCIMEDVSYNPLSQSCVNTTYKRMTFTERASQSGQTLARYIASHCVKAFVATAAVNEVRE
jgi:hypothetical protein